MFFVLYTGTGSYCIVLQTVAYVNVNRINHFVLDDHIVLYKSDDVFCVSDDSPILGDF